MNRQATAARREYKRLYRIQNRDKINAYHRQWAKNNPDKIKKYQDRYWSKKSRGF